MTIETKDEFYVAGLSIMTTTDTSLNHQDFMGLWDRFFKEDVRSQVSDRCDEVIYCVYDQYQVISPGVYSVRATVGYEVPSSTSSIEGLTLATVRQGAYLHLPVKGKMPDCVVTKWAEIWERNESLNRAFETDYERYGLEAKESGEMDIFLSI